MKSKSDKNYHQTEGCEGYAVTRIIILLIIACAGFLLVHHGMSYVKKHGIFKKAVVEKQQTVEEAPEIEITKEAHSEPSEEVPAEGAEEKASPSSHTEESPGDQTIADIPEKSGPVNVTGITFVEATYSPLEYELEKRFYGWRPNDYIKLTDNVNNFQKGVLEVTRKTAVILFERISRTGSTVSFNQNLENAQNWFMVQSTRYYVPFFQSPESKYRDGIEELKKYRAKLLTGEAKFYNRADNLIPLLESYKNLLGSCDDNLVKSVESDGNPVSIFDADNYFYYAQGVASTIETILRAVEVDFHTVLVSRYGKESLHHAIESCRKAANIKPWIITDASLSGVFANHRANMATAISHARFHIGVLIKTLST